MSGSVARARVLAGFRRLNKARAQLFQGDDNAMQVSRQQMRAEFEKNKYASTAGPEFEALVAGIDEAADMLRNEILRGNLNQETGRYGRYTTNRYNFRYSFSLPFSNTPVSFFIN
jgi:hypothetical protein